MKAKFLASIILCCVAGNSCSMTCIFYNQSKVKCSVDLREIPLENMHETDLHMDLKTKKGELCENTWLPYGFDNIRDISSTQFSLSPNEYKCIKFDFPSGLKNANEGVIIRRNGVEVGVAYPATNWSFDKEDIHAIFFVNEAQGLVLYKKYPYRSGEQVIKILDFDKNVRYINPPNGIFAPPYILNEWPVELSEDDSDPRPPYGEKAQDIPNILFRAKQKDVDEKNVITIEEMGESKSCCSIC